MSKNDWQIAQFFITLSNENKFTLFSTPVRCRRFYKSMKSTYDLSNSMDYTDQFHLN